MRTVFSVVGSLSVADRPRYRTDGAGTVTQNPRVGDSIPPRFRRAAPGNYNDVEGRQAIREYISEFILPAVDE